MEIVKYKKRVNLFWENGNIIVYIQYKLVYHNASIKPLPSNKPPLE